MPEETKTGKTTAPEVEAGTDRSRPSRQSFWWLILLLVIVMPVAFLVRMPETPLDKAIGLVKSNKSAAALPILEEIAAKQPENLDVLPWLAVCYLNTDRIAEGRTALDTAIKMKLPASTLEPGVRSFIAYYCQQNDYAEAERLFEHMRAMRPQQLNNSKELNDERRKLYLAWAEYDSSRNKIDDAITHLKAAVSLPDTTDSDKEQMLHRIAEHYRQLAATAETVNNDEKRAIDLLEMSLTQIDELATRLALADLYTKTENYKLAAENLRKVAGMDANNLEARHKLVEMCLKMDDKRAARDALIELLDKEKSLENYQLLAGLNLQLENYAGSVRALEDASSLSRNDARVLTNLRNALLAWSASLARTGKLEESLSVKARADRISEMIKGLDEPDIDTPDAPAATAAAKPELPPGGPPIGLTASRIWLSKGSLTPEGEITVKNVSSEDLTDLSLSAVFFDNTSKKRTGSVSVSAASTTHPLQSGQVRTLYFSSPNIVKSDHILCVLIFWKGKLIRELPVVKER